MKYYTYAHQTADTGKIFYIGKGVKSRYCSNFQRNKYWHHIVNKHGFNAEIIAYWETEQKALDHEKLLISSFKDMGYELANLSDGGESGSSGVKRTAEQVEAYRQRALKQTNNPEWKSFISSVHKGKKLSEKHIQSMKDKFGKPVICVELSKKFSSIKDAAKYLKENGLPKAATQAIGACANGIRKSAYGYSWKYVV